MRDGRGRDHMLDGFTLVTTDGVSCEFKYR